jgi:two-component system, cell cycle sensor histidine kinase and response regulator CckA
MAQGLFMESGFHAHEELEKLAAEQRIENDKLKEELAAREQAQNQIQNENEILLQIIKLNPYSISVYDLEGRFINGNKAYLELFPIPPPREYSFFEDPLIEKCGFKDDVLQLKEGKIIRLPAFWYNPHDIKPEYPDQKVCIGGMGFPIFGLEGKIEGYVLMHEDFTASKKAEEAIAKSEERYRSLFDSSPEPITIVGLDGKVIEVNQATERIIGYKREEIIGKRFTELNTISPDDISKYLELFSALVNGGDVGAIEVEVLPKDGEKRVVEASVSRLNIDGETVAFQAISKDVTEYRRAIEALRISEEKLRAMFDSVADGMIVTDMGFRIVDVNPAGLHMFGFENKAEVLGANGLRYIRKENHATIFGNVKKLNEPDFSDHLDLTCLKKNGEEFPVEASTALLKDEAGQPVGFIGIVKDITERRRAQEEITKSEQVFRLIFESNKDAIFWADPETGVILNCNRAAEILLEKKREEIIGHHQTELHPHDNTELYAGIFKKHIENKGALDMDANVITSAGKLIPVIISSTVTEVGGKLINQGIFRDVTERKKAEQEKEELQRQLLQSQKMQAIGTMAGGLAHDFNNILAVIMGTASTAIEKLPPGDPSSEKFKRVLKASHRAKDITMKLLTFARKEKLRVETVPAGEIVSDLVDMLKRMIPKNIAIKSNAGCCECHIAADVNQIQQALLNICINAGDSMPEGGTLEISASAVSLGEAEATSIPGAGPGGYCLLEIRDTGSGIPEDIIGNIFDPFFTTKEKLKGTGLGLSVTLGIIRNHGGFVDVSSRPDEGTVFKVFLPVAEAECAARADKKLSGFRGAGETILVVDDQLDFLELAVEMLREEGYSATGAGSGAEALSLFESRGGAFDLVVLDMRMPGMDGAKVFRELRKIDPCVKVIICSGYSMDNQADEELKKGIRSFLQKPFDTAELCAMVRAALDSE